MPEPSTTDRTRVQTHAPTVSRESVQGFPTIPGYEILRELGRGGMGVVYEARQQALGRVVAIKLMQKDDGLHQARFLAEGQIIAALKHPNVVEVHDFGESSAGSFIAMEYLPGGTFGARLRAEPKLQPRDAAELIAQIAAGVGAAHANQIVHRDLKPGNVLLDANGVPKVTDFGLAKRTDYDLTLTHEAAGTPSYMAPEQARAMKFVGPPADVWSLGVMLYEALTGRKPFVADSDAALLVSIQTDNPPTLRTISKTIPPDLETICLKCLEKEPDRRYATAEELSADLRRWLEGKPIVARRATLVEKAMLWVRRKPAVAASWALGLLVVLLGAFAVTAGMLWRKAEHEKGIAVGLKGEAEAARDNSDRAKARAETAEGLALKSQSDIAEQRERLAYARNVYLAYMEYERDDCVRANRFLNQCPESLRSWEWHFVHRLCHSEWLELADHESLVSSVSYDPTGTKILTAALGESARIWDAATGQLVKTLSVPKGKLFSAAFSPDGRSVLTGEIGGIARVWSLETGQEVRTLSGHTVRVFTASMNRDGDRIVTAGFDRTARIWDALTGQELHKLAAHRGPVSSANFSPDGSRIVTSSYDGTAMIWDARSGKDLFTLNAHAGQVFFASFDPNGTRVATSGADRTVRIWNAGTGALINTISGHRDWVQSVRFDSTGTRIITASTDRTARLWDVASGRELTMFKGHLHWVHSAAIDPSGKWVATASEDRTVKVWPIQPTIRNVVLQNPGRPFFRSCLSSSGNRVAAYGSDSSVSVWDAQRGDRVTTLTGHSVFDLQRGDRVATATGHTAIVNDAVFSPDGSRVATAGEDAAIKIWDAKTGGVLQTLLGHVGPVTAVTFDQTGDRLVSGGADRSVKIWDRQTGQVQQSLDAYPSIVFSVDLSRDGTRVAAGCDTGAVLIRNLSANTTPISLVGHGRLVRCLAFDPTGTQLATGCDDGTARLWDVRTGRELYVLTGHTAGIQSLAFNTDSTRLVTGGEDGALKVWDLSTGTELLSMHGHQGSVTRVRFHEDQKLIRSVGRDSTIREWDSRPVNPRHLLTPVPK
jgi:WD40 repeat protein